MSWKTSRKAVQPNSEFYASGLDTMGRIDLTSVQVLESTHELFTRAVRDILGTFKFKPAESNGHRLRAMAEMPFEFQMRK